MTDETKIKMMEALAKSGMSVGQFILEPAGTFTSTTSPTFLFSSACAIGELMEIFPSRRFAS